MGSLMAGWDAPVVDEHTARFRRNKSLTREEISAFWRSRSPRTSGDMNLSPSGSPANSPGFLNDTERIAAASPFSRSQNDALQTNSLPNSPRMYNDQAEEAASKSNKTGAWWTRSNSAFLNEPPREEMHGMVQKYTPQFHVARLATGNA